MFSIIHLLDRNPIRLLLLHIILGLIASWYSIFSTVWGWSVVIFGGYYIMKYRNHSNAAGLFAAYLVGLEILLRMTGAEVLWEFGKYGTIALLTLGLIIENIKHARQHRAVSSRGRTSSQGRYSRRDSRQAAQAFLQGAAKRPRRFPSRAFGQRGACRGQAPDPAQ